MNYRRRTVSVTTRTIAAYVYELEVMDSRHVISKPPKESPNEMNALHIIMSYNVSNVKLTKYKKDIFDLTRDIHLCLC